MPFDKVDTQIDFPAQERAILDFWQRIHAFDKLREGGSEILVDVRPLMSDR